MRQLVFSLFFLILSSCVGNNNKSVVTSKYGAINEESLILDDKLRPLKSVGVENINMRQMNIRNDSIVKRCRYLMLDDDKYPIGDVDKIMVHDSLLFVLCVNNGKLLSSYNTHTGDFHAKYGTLGKSKQEYLEVTDFAIVRNRVVILDNKSKKIITFDMNGNYLGTTRLKYSLLSITASLDGDVLYAISGDNRHISSVNDALVFKIDSLGRIMSKHIVSHNRLNYTYLNHIKNNGKIVYAYDLFSSKIISLGDTTDRIIYNLNFGNDALPSDYLEECDGDYTKFMDTYRERYSYINKFYDFDKYLFIPYTSQGKYGCLGVYNKNSNDLIYNAFPFIDSKSINEQDIVLMSLSSSACCEYNGNVCVVLSDSFAALLKSNKLLDYNVGEIVVCFASL